jgi:DNA-binding transcriptional LysR family regulator
MNSRVTLSQLRVFLAALEHGNLTIAASELEMSQSAVSHALAELERNLGARLLERGRFGAKATVLGEQIAVQSRIIFRAEMAMLEEVSASQGQLKGLVRIASLRSVATHVLPDLIKAFRKLHNGVQFEIQSGEGVAHGVEKAVLKARADLGLMAAPIESGLDVYDFFKDEWVALFPSSQAPKNQVATWQEILELPFLLCNEAGAPTLRAYFAQHQQTLAQAAQVEDDSVILSMVAHGFGVSILARLATLPVPEGVTVRLLPERLERKIVMAVQPKLRSVVVEAFLEFLRSART